jgi:hypothetical protein
MVAMLDIDHSGKLGLKEFTILLNDIAKWRVSCHPLPLPTFSSWQFSSQAVYKHFTQGIDKLHASELRSVLASVGYRLNKPILNSLVYRYASSGGKNFDFDDFIHCAIKVKTIIGHFQSKDFKNSDQATFTLEEWITKSLYSWSLCNKQKKSFVQASTIDFPPRMRRAKLLRNFESTH